MLGPANQEILMRARADLRLGVPIVLAGKENSAIIAPIEVLNESRLSQLKAIDKLIKDKKVEESMAKLKQVMSVLHKSTQKKIMHLNKASRTISKLQKDISAISK